MSSHQAGKSSDIKKLTSEAQKSTRSFTLAIRTNDASIIDQTRTSLTSASTDSTTITNSVVSNVMETPLVDSISAEDHNSSVGDDDAEVESILKSTSDNTRASSKMNSSSPAPILIHANFHRRHAVKG